VRGNFNQEISPVCGKVEGKSHIPRCEQIRNWRDGLLERIGIRKMASNKIKDMAKTGQCV
jgi:hypothetical protein